jgi:hypothetical protein
VFVLIVIYSKYSRDWSPVPQIVHLDDERIVTNSTLSHPHRCTARVPQVSVDSPIEENDNDITDGSVCLIVLFIFMLCRILWTCVIFSKRIERHSDAMVSILSFESDHSDYFICFHFVISHFSLQKAFACNVYT